MALPNTWATRELARLGADYASIVNSNSDITWSKWRSEWQVPDKTEGSLLLPTQYNWTWTHKSS